MRETQLRKSAKSNLSGITPAYAGNTEIMLIENLEEEDHPRVCGKHLIQVFVLPHLAGSPPRMRETLK